MYVCSFKYAAQFMVLLIVLDWFIPSIFKMIYLVKRHHTLLGLDGNDGALKEI